MLSNAISEHVLFWGMTLCFLCLYKNVVQTGIDALPSKNQALCDYCMHVCK